MTEVSIVKCKNYECQKVKNVISESGDSSGAYGYTAKSLDISRIKKAIEESGPAR